MKAEPQWEEIQETVYATSDIALWAGPDHNTKVLSYLSRGESAVRTAASSNGWSRLQADGKTVYACTAYLSADPEIKVPAVVTSEAEFPTPNAPFIYQYMAPENIMPHALFTPAEADLTKPLPLLISLHGALEIGEAPNTL